MKSALPGNAPKRPPGAISHYVQPRPEALVSEPQRDVTNRVPVNRIVTKKHVEPRRESSKRLTRRIRRQANEPHRIIDSLFQPQCTSALSLKSLQSLFPCGATILSLSYLVLNSAR